MSEHRRKKLKDVPNGIILTEDIAFVDMFLLNVLEVEVLTVIIERLETGFMTFEKV